MRTTNWSRIELLGPPLPEDFVEDYGESEKAPKFHPDAFCGMMRCKTCHENHERFSIHPSVRNLPWLQPQDRIAAKLQAREVWQAEQEAEPIRRMRVKGRTSRKERTATVRRPDVVRAERITAPLPRPAGPKPVLRKVSR